VVVHTIAIRQKGVRRWAIDIAKGHLPALARSGSSRSWLRPFTAWHSTFGNIFAGGIMLSIIATLVPI